MLYPVRYSWSSAAVLAFSLSLLSSGPLPAAATPEQPAPPAEATAPELPKRHREFLESTAMLIGEEERAAFLSLRQDYQRDAFIRRFWDVRDPFPKTPQNELRERWEERERVARDRFGGLDDDRARMLLFHGAPIDVFESRCSDLLLPLQIWLYPGTDRIRNDFTLVFVSRTGAPRGPFQLWYPTAGIGSLLSLEWRVRAPQGVGPATIAEVCPRGDEIAGLLGGALDWELVKDKVVPTPPREWLATFLSRSTDVPEEAGTFSAEVGLTFPGRYGSRTVVQALVGVPRSGVRPDRPEGSEASVYGFLVDGEILYRDTLFESFRYRFIFPEGDARADKLPLIFQRFLRPGSYTFVLRVQDTGSGRFFREERVLEVPSVEQASAAVAETGSDTAPPAGSSAGSPVGSAALTEANAALGTDEQTIRILPPPEGLITGRLRVEALTTGEGVHRVAFALDGRPVLTKGRPPFSVELNLGDQPRLHTVTATALGDSGQSLASDEILVNAGPHRFSVRLLEPQPGKTYRESLRAIAQVEVPEGERLERVELFLNETRIATLYQPPFSQPILLPPGGEISYVRAVAVMADGNSTEDTVLINAPDFGERVDVDFVELYTTVVDGKGRPVEGLSGGDFTVLEDGVEQQVTRFERVTDVPIYAGILLDTSASMGEGQKLESAVRGALEFFRTVITPKDRAAVITFNDQPSLAVRFSNDPEVLAGGLAGLAPGGGTALYDSLVYALYYFGGLKGKRAVVLLSDGQDEGSRYAFDEVLDYARRSGVALYTVGIGLSHREADVRVKLQRLAEETGGRFFFIDRAGELTRVYEKVESELRSQYLLSYQSSNPENRDKFRLVEVKVARPGLEAKTLRGYYP